MAHYKHGTFALLKRSKVVGRMPGLEALRGALERPRQGPRTWIRRGSIDVRKMSADIYLVVPLELYLE